MDQESRIKIEAAVRVRSFFLTRPFGDALADAVVASFGEMVAEVLSLAQIELEGHATFHASSLIRSAMRDRIRRGNLLHLSRVGAAAAKEVRTLDGIFKLPPKRRNESDFCASSQVTLELAVENEAVLLRHGMGAGVIADLTRQLRDYDRAIVAGNAGRAAHTGAREAIRVRSSELLGTIRQLEGMLLLQFEDNPNLEGAWRSARNVPWAARHAEPAAPEAAFVEPPGSE